MSTETKWTPGPWVVRNSDEWSCCVSTLEGNNVDGDPMYWTVASLNGLRDEKKANATLIAEAPELYKALERALNFIANTESEWGIQLDSGDAARAALSKARGEAQ